MVVINKFDRRRLIMFKNLKLIILMSAIPILVLAIIIFSMRYQDKNSGSIKLWPGIKAGSNIKGFAITVIPYYVENFSVKEQFLLKTLLDAWMQDTCIVFIRGNKSVLEREKLLHVVIKKAGQEYFPEGCEGSAEKKIAETLLSFKEVTEKSLNKGIGALLGVPEDLREAVFIKQKDCIRKLYDCGKLPLHKFI
jgi:hypothetical protein